MELLGSYISVGMGSVSLDIDDDVEVRPNSGLLIAGSFPSRISCNFRWRGVLNNVSERNGVLGYGLVLGGDLEAGD